MALIIAATYEVTQELGSGGGGVVYLARHLRLGKWVVLKADKRSITAKPEALRREVDALKDLSHTYIPQVYDFFAENGVVYTVMDYIEGESLDKPLNRGERFSQAQVIEWACELLEALRYLHSRPPHGILHGDIKPANIMLTPQGDIRLIDFNIALALGEKGAVKAGTSRGYASPEHYGISYAPGSATQGLDEGPETQIPAVLPETVIEESTGERPAVLLDVRSDLYSLGATLYHLLTGIRPPQDPREAAPISHEACSPAVSGIVLKAMAPLPERRWQTAEEMLRAFERLHENDPRARRHRRRKAITAAVLAVCFLAGGACTFVGLKQMEQTQNARALAEYSADALRSGDVPGAAACALEALPAHRGLLDPPYIPQAQRALTAALGVYDLSDGYQPHRALALPGGPMKVSLSPRGTRLAALTGGQVNVFDTESGQTLAALPADPSALSDVVFAGENRIIYAGEGALRACDLDGGQILWSGKPATAIALSADGATVAAVYKEESVAAVYDAATGETREAVTFHGKRQRVTVNDGFADPEDALFALNGDGSWLAASFADGSLRLFDLADSENDLEIYDTSPFTHFEGGFFGPYFAFSATGEGESVFAVIDLVHGEQTGGFSAQTPFHAYADESGVYVSTENLLVKLDPVTGEQTELAYTGADITAFSICGSNTLAAASDGTISFFDQDARLLERQEGGAYDFVGLSEGWAVAASRDIPALRVLRKENHTDAQIFTYDPDFLHDEARVSSDGATVMLFRYDAFRLYASGGAVLAEVLLPDPEQVYDQQYRRDEQGDRLEVIYNDGLIRAYSAVDGGLLWETQGERPDGSFLEEFYTDKLKIVSPLHGTPAAYDRESGALVRELEPDAFLTYVTQVGTDVVTEYISAQGDRYGLLLNHDCETLADLPDLCDVTADGRLIFDDMRGNLRQSRIYSLQELLALGESYRGGT